ncbi:uncharacterized protein LOC114290187 [Camellia sinensis]|uniref:DUF309 domain-containing protein n=1 Tax=Camellia sinensis var. sinensis TaxID=542762 RepID=A0A4S4DP09_CAMSN|nr:uncharacterized protein LOC114290187 [Camellia sinensis]THG04759.1 hypothetical protein TEA_029587 [Camellia sinensis var. sinensis]
MASLSVSHLSLVSPPRFNHILSSSSLPLLLKYQTAKASGSISASYRFSSGIDEEEDDHRAAGGFKEAVALFNGGDYYKCHDLLEDLWNQAQEPPRTLFHGILQCAVGFYHLFNQNHKGAMMELGEGLCKLRKMNFESGPFLQFEKEISAVLDFIYLTQLELAACTDDFCIALDQSERSYQLLGGYAAGQRLYCLESDPNDIIYIVFCPERSYGTGEPPRVKLPTLNASGEHLKEIEYNGLD